MAARVPPTITYWRFPGAAPIGKRLPLGLQVEYDHQRGGWVVGRPGENEELLLAARPVQEGSERTGAT